MRFCSHSQQAGQAPQYVQPQGLPPQQSAQQQHRNPARAQLPRSQYWPSVHLQRSQWVVRRNVSVECRRAAFVARFGVLARLPSMSTPVPFMDMEQDAPSICGVSCSISHVKDPGWDKGASALGCQSGSVRCFSVQVSTQCEWRGFRWVAASPNSSTTTACNANHAGNMWLAASN